MWEIVLDFVAFLENLNFKNDQAFYLKVFYINSSIVINISIWIMMEYDSNSKLIGFI